MEQFPTTKTIYIYYPELRLLHSETTLTVGGENIRVKYLVVNYWKLYFTRNCCGKNMSTTLVSAVHNTLGSW